jgi:hypothetical protein
MWLLGTNLFPVILVARAQSLYLTDDMSVLAHADFATSFLHLSSDA